MTKKRGLGKGLEALIPTLREREEAVVNLNLAEIKPNPYQPRRKIDPGRLEELVSSIKKKGIVQPILVRRGVSGYELIAGERRLRAVKEAGLSEIPAIIREAKDGELLELALVENLQREDLNPVEEARAYQKLVESFNLTHGEIAERVGKDRSTVTNTLRLLNLPLEVQGFILNDELTPGHARAILSLEREELQIILAHKIVEKGLSVREAETMAKRLEKGRKKIELKKDPQILALEDELQRVLGTKVRINYHQSRGKIEIEFYSNSDLERILKILKV